MKYDAILLSNILGAKDIWLVQSYKIFLQMRTGESYILKELNVQR